MNILKTTRLSAITLSCVAAIWMGTASPVHAIIAQHSAPETAGAAESTVDIHAAQKDAPFSAALNPQDAVWKSAQGIDVPLYPQSVVQPYGGGATPSVEVRVLRLNNGVAIRLSWADSTRDDGRSSGEFKDGAAVEFPLNRSSAALAMGHEGRPVDIWHWMAAAQGLNDSKHNKRLLADKFSPVEDLLAAGFYNRQRKPAQTVQGRGEWADGRWSVVFFKAFVSEDQESPGLDEAADIPMAIAVWNGSAGERLGLKSVSNWTVLHLK